MKMSLFTYEELEEGWSIKHYKRDYILEAEEGVRRVEDGCGDSEGGHSKKVLTPSRRKEMAAQVVKEKPV